MAIADKFRENHGQAAAAQQASRNGRRVIRRLADEDETPIAVEQVPMVVEQLPPPASTPRSATHSVITVSPLDLPVEQFSSGLQRRKQNRELLMEWLRSALVDGVDYGRIHVVSKDRCSFAKQGRVKDCGDSNHWSKPSLFKPGAEKITGMLGMTTHFPSLRQYEEAVLNKCEISTTRDCDRREWATAKSKDGDDSQGCPFRLEVMEIGTDDEGEQITSCVVTADEQPGEAMRRVLPPKSGNQRIVWDELGKLFRAAGCFAPEGAPKELPGGRPCLRLEDAIAKPLLSGAMSRLHTRPHISKRRICRFWRAIAGQL